MTQDISFYMKLQREEVEETFEDNQDQDNYQEEREAHYAESHRDFISDVY